MTQKQYRRLNYISLFSGIGGFERGIETSNKSLIFNCIGYSEIDKYAKDIYKRHFPQHKDLGDVTKINTGNLPELDLLVGGFPCQAFSVAGKRRGFDDTRGTLFFEIARILRDKRPRYFLLENVKGLLSHEGGKTLQTILRILSELGYDVEWKIYNSTKYGTCQARERIYFKGFLRDECESEILCPFTKNEIEQNIFKQDKKINVLNRPEHQGDGIYDPANAMPTLTRGTVPKIMFRNGKTFKIRKITPIEAERLQGFPDNWTKYGVLGNIISDHRRYMACGNAVTVNVIREIFNEWDFNFQKQGSRKI